MLDASQRRLKMKKKEIIKTIKGYVGNKEFDIPNSGLPKKNYRDLLTYLQSVNNSLSDKDRVRVLMQVFVGVGITAMGAKLLTLALLDPEPTSKLTILTAGGILLMGLGGVAVLHALGQQWQVSVYKNSVTLKPAR
jgi:hypothetical protein